MFNKLFSKAKSPLQNDVQRAALQQAILNNQPVEFRDLLNTIDPALSNQVRIYGVLINTPHGIVPLLVDNTGQTISSDSMITPETPIDILNARLEGDEIIANIDGEEWRVSI